MLSAGKLEECVLFCFEMGEGAFREDNDHIS